VVIDYCKLRISQDGISAATANREASLLRNMLNRAVEWEILERNSLDNYRLLKEADKREVLVSPAQIQRLLDLLKPPMADIAEFAVYTGLRKENILSLKIEQVTLYDLEPGGEIELVVKGGKRRTKPLGEKAAAIIKRNIGTRQMGHVFINTRFGTRYKSINKVFDRAVIKAGLEVDGSKLRFHDLRHVTASWLSQKGVSLDIIRVLLDHEDRDTTDRYVSHDLRAYGELLNLIPAIRKEA
jgi:integrase